MKLNLIYKGSVVYYGGIHNVEKEWGITGIDNEIATRLETFINNLRR
ncbi:hypothetical protein [Bacillus mycoides]|nr:hypothetical protein [Bacillus mycoides]MBJ7997775.1 hypothetical protein [Bacillus cereus]MED1405577.1 hypothetical protein [Bacillus mycoides]QWI98059.1 hypothetical protein J5V73_15985 [Bacillus mycoides]UNJ93802.1 hypothetical protein MN093_25730 [Bacillus mycoides]